MTSAVNALPRLRPNSLVVSRTLLVCLLLALGACTERSPREVLSGATMGTTWSVVYGRVDGVEREALQVLIEAELEDINAGLSTYLSDSEITRLNELPGVATVQVSEQFATVLDAALAIGERTAGAYDVTVGPLVELWGFGSQDFSDRVPDADAVAEAAAQVGASRLSWDRTTRTLTRPAAMRIDLSSVAKGYAVDRVSDALAAMGISNSLVEIGGELRARGERPEGGLWQLAVESPEPGMGRFIAAIKVADGAVATSGDYRNYFEIDGVRYSHLVDPRTGYPVTHELVSVTVVSDNCMEADALATAFIVMGLEEARSLAEQQGIAAYFVWRDSDGLEVHYTPEFASYRRSDGV